MQPDVYISFSADTDELQGALDKARAQVRAFHTDLDNAARQMRQTGAAADADRSQKIASLAASLHPAAPPPSDKDDAEVAEASYTAEVDVAKRAAEQEIDSLNNLVKAHKISWEEWDKESVAALEKEKAALEAANKQAQNSDAITAAEKIRLANDTYNEIAAINRKEADDAAKAAQETQQAWDNFFKPFNSAFDQLITSVVSGHETIRQDLKKTLDSMLADVLKFYANWAVKQAEVSLIEPNFGPLIAAARSAIGALAGMVGAEVAANQAFITGPGAVTEGLGAAAVIGGLAGGIGSADIGIWNVPQDQINLIHQNELVMPAAEAGAFRDMLSAFASGGGGGGRSVTVAPTTHFNIMSMDSATVASTLMSNNGAIVKAVEQGVRHGAALGLRGLRR